MWVVLGVLFVTAIVIAIVATAWTSFEDKFIYTWMQHIKTGSRLSKDSTNQLKRDDVFIFLAKQTRFRVVKYNGHFFTQFKTFGTGWKDYVYNEWFGGSNDFLTLEDANNAITTAVANVCEYIETSDYEDPDRYRKIVVASQDVVVKEMR